MVFSIMIYFTFISIKYNEQVIQLGQVRERIAATLTASSVVLAIFALIFIWYSNSFFNRKRKKEIALYSLLGIKKKQIGRMLFYENIVMGFFALLVGIFLGSLLSKVFIMLLIRLMGFSTLIKFSIIPEAIIGTIKVFAFLFLLTSVHGYTIIYRFKLVELFKAERSAEREPKVSIIKAVLSVVFIVGGYWFYLTSKINFLFLILITLISVVIGTFLFFSSLLVFIIKLSRKNMKRYYQGINMVRTSNLLYRIKGHARTLAIIAVLSATTITAMSVAASIYYDFKTKLDIVAPFSYVYMSDNQKVYEKLTEEIDDTISSYPAHQIKKTIGYDVIRLKASLPSGLQGSYSEHNIYFMSESKYNEIAELRGIEKITLNSENETVFIDEYYNELFKESYIGKTIKVYSNNQTSEFKVKDLKKYSILNMVFLLRTMVVKDEVFNRYIDSGNIFRGKAYKISNENKSEELTAELTKLIGKNRSKDKTWEILFTSFYKYYQRGIINYGQGIFVGGFLGLVFLLSTGSIIFFKLLSEAGEEKPVYKILRNIGVTQKEIRALLSGQILFIFSMPLIVGIIHSLVAVTILEKLLGTNLTIPISITIIIYTLIYMVYFILTVNSYNQIVSE